MSDLPPLGNPVRMDSAHVLQQLEALKEHLLNQNPDLRVGSMSEMDHRAGGEEGSTANRDQTTGTAGGQEQSSMMVISEDKLRLLIQEYVEARLKEREDCDGENYKARNSEISSGHDFAEMTSMSTESAESHATVQADRAHSPDPDRRPRLGPIHVRAHREKTMFDPELAMSPSPGYRPSTFRVPTMKHDHFVVDSTSSRPSNPNRVYPDALTEVDQNKVEESGCCEVENVSTQDLDEGCMWV
ncbi:hypothetical protein GUITHDRAFT_152565, partial [Guillardia theta CCMP2712]